MSTGAGLACLAGALIIVGTFWAAAWASVRSAADRAKAAQLVAGLWDARTRK